ncbi:TonB-dependent receptor [Rubrivirga sp. S365]|uniref:TonB-dependent receptor plug domain-containing protein n=1 Tax=Rubrivirga sp. S365 TaxID=3076080 RepID=UPI0028C70FFB|nr:TonB-dependent receptor [Rubrivirga sp. S365]MDT7855736.1 TonB-dependent receptor [Rubrivirga sp. S365]
MRLPARPFLLAATLAALAAAPRAQTPSRPPRPAPADSVELGEVTVTATREALPTREAPVRVTVLDREALDATAAASLAGVLEARAPVHVRRYGPSGLATVTVRGASSQQALVLLDGQRLTDPQLGQVDLSLLPTALLESVEVLSGPASGLYGSDAVGGVVHLRPPRRGAPEARLGTDVGPWGERRAHALGAGRVGGVRALVAAEATRAEDDYAFRDRSRLDAPLVTRRGWDSRQASVYATAAVGAEPGGEGRGGAGLSLWAADAERGLGGDGDVGARQWDRRVRLAAAAHRQTPWARVEAAASLQRTRLRYAAPFPAPPDRPDAIDDTGRTTAAFLDLRATTERWGGAWALALSAGAGRGEHPSLQDDALDRFAGAALSGRVAWGRWAFFPSARADVYAPSGADRRLALSPQLGANVALAPSLTLKTNAARAFRMPTLNDRFWQPGGNPDLRPETAWSADGGLVWSGRGVQAEASAFATWARDQIVWAPRTSTFFEPANVARTRSLGLEGSVRAARAVRLAGRPALVEGGALATYVDARDRGTDAPLRYVPRWTAKAWGGAGWGALRLDLGARIVGARFTTASGSQPLPAYLVVDAQASVRRAVGAVDLTLGLAAENLTGAQYEVVQSYPMPPRHARVRLTIRTR